MICLACLGTHSPAIMFGALPQGILLGLPLLLKPSSRTPGAARGLARTKAGVKQAAKASNERRVLNRDIFQGVLRYGRSVRVKMESPSVGTYVRVFGCICTFVYLAASWQCRAGIVSRTPPVFRERCDRRKGARLLLYRLVFCHRRG